ncbi:MAG: 3-keto-disaccharide hydrolase, partial [Verrucomicrobiales bacterium]
MRWIVCLLLLPCLSGCNQSPKCDQIFDGESMDGWSATSDANWRVEDGAIVVDSGAKGLLIHEGGYENYELELEFKADAGTNSGVFLCTIEKPESVTEDCYELNIAP